MEKHYISTKKEKSFGDLKINKRQFRQRDRFMKRHNAYMMCIIVWIMVVMMGWQGVKAEPPMLYLGLFNTETGQGAFGNYQPGVSAGLNVIREQFPQYSCIKYGYQGKIFGLTGTRLDEINPVSGQMTPGWI